jgi:hypothetical protein
MHFSPTAILLLGSAMLGLAGAMPASNAAQDGLENRQEVCLEPGSVCTVLPDSSVSL